MNKNFRSILSVSFCLLSFIINAQQIARSTYSYPEFSLRTSLTSFVDYDAGIMLGVNYRWSDHLSASFEPTWIFFSPFFDSNGDSFQPSGFKIRTDFRYHFGIRKKKNPNFFIAPEFHYKNVTTKSEGQFGINCQSGQCDYFQTAEYKTQKKEIGGLIKAGLTVPLTFIEKRDHLLLEIYGGFGAKELKYKELDIPPGASFLNPPDRGIFDFGNDSDRNTIFRPMIPFGIKVILII